MRKEPPPGNLPPALLDCLRALLAIPIAPYAEDDLIRAIRERVRCFPAIRLSQDRAGNLFLRYRPPSARKAALCFHAHLDHPGFLVQRCLASGLAEVEALGGMPCDVEGARIRFFPAGRSRGIIGNIVSVRRDNWGSIRKLRVNFNRQVKPGTIGMWDLPPLAVRAQRLAGRGLDDTLGAAILVWLVETAAQRRWRRPFDVLLTRAEEIGAPAAWVAAAALPPGKAIITIEMPNAIGEIRAGDGAIIRTGDAVTSFDPQILAHIEAEAQRLARRNPWFRFQRRLGWRGGTESTIFGLCGLRVAGISLPIVNYHNIGPANRPAAEQADLGDLRSLLLLLETLARRPFAPKRSWQDLRRRLGQRLRRMALRLKKKVRSEHKYSVNR